MRFAVRYLASRDRTIAQVERFLRVKGASPAQARQTVSRLSHLRYVNDRAYAERWVARRLAGKPMGRDRLKAELRAKGIVDAVADEAIREILRGIDEEMLARRALAAGQRSGRRKTVSELLRLLRQRGFAEETIDRMVGTMMEREGLEA